MFVCLIVCFPITDFAGSKGLHHLMNDNSLQMKSDLDKPINVTNSNSTQDSKTPFAREMLRDVLDGLVESDILETCVDDLQILTEHSGSKMCELLSEAERTRNLMEIGESISKDWTTKEDLKDYTSSIGGDSTSQGRNEFFCFYEQFDF